MHKHPSALVKKKEYALPTTSSGWGGNSRQQWLRFFFFLESRILFFFWRDTSTSRQELFNKSFCGQLIQRTVISTPSESPISGCSRFLHHRKYLMLAFDHLTKYTPSWCIFACVCACDSSILHWFYRWWCVNVSSLVFEETTSKSSLSLSFRVCVCAQKERTREREKTKSSCFKEENLSWNKKDTPASRKMPQLFSFQTALFKN